VLKYTCAIVAAAAAMLALPGAASAAPASDSTCQTNGQVRAIAYSGGVVYVGGLFSQAIPPGGGSGVARQNLMACSASTGAILPWNPGADGEVWSLDASGANIEAGGAFTHLGGAARAHVGSVTAAGSVTGWDPHASSTVYVVRNGPDGKVYLGGLFGKIGGATHARIGRVSASTGAPDSTFAVTVGQVTGFNCPPRCPPVVYTIDFQGGNVYFGGQFGLVNGVSRNTAAAVNGSGGLLAWNPNIYAPANCPACTTVETSRVYTLITAGASVYTCGGYWKVNGTKTSYNLSRWNATTGALDPSFTVQDDGDTPGCALHGSVIYYGGHFNVTGNGCRPGNTAPCVTRHHIAAANVATNTALSWNPGANSVHGVYTVQADSTHVAAGGFFTKLGGRVQAFFGQFSGAPTS
jgi:hypothetical protein